MVNKSFIQTAKHGITLMHPLPRVDEIAREVDEYEGSAYFRQAANGVPIRMAVIASLANYLLFFGPEIVRNARQRNTVRRRRQRYEESAVPADAPLHQCVVCRRSDVSNPELDFRVGRDGNDYCTEHLPTAK